MKKGTKVTYVVPDIVGEVTGSVYSEDEGRVTQVKVAYVSSDGQKQERFFSVDDPALKVVEAADEQH
jgi:hypothetical protein